MKRRLQKLTVMLLSVALLLCLLPMTAIGADPDGEAENTAQAQKVCGYIPMPRVGSRALTNAYLSGGPESRTRSTLPASYDSRSYGYITAVGNQNPYGTCWSFATIAPIEAYMIKHGIINGETGVPAVNTMNLSEYHLAWFNYTNAYDKLGMLAGDSSKALGANFLNRGGNSAMATLTMMRWEGPASESIPALAYNHASGSGINAQYAYDYDVAHVTNCVWIPARNRDAVKEAIMEYGACSISYFHDDYDAYFNSVTSAYCFKQSAEYGSDYYEYPNHAVTVVGWDDNYSRNNFNAASRPSEDGAWIIKNSWSTDWGNNGYFYLSYEDTASYNEDCYFYEVSNLDSYTNNYQYDGTCNVAVYQGIGNGGQIANVFTANGREVLKAVAVNTWDEAVTYKVEIFVNPADARDPSSGTLASTQEGYLPHYGYFTIPLDEPVNLNAGDVFAVVITMTTPEVDPGDGLNLHPPYDCTFTISWASWIHADRGDTSFYREAGGSWNDCPEGGDFRIKAYTDDITFLVNAVSNNESWGTVQVNGSVVTALPAVGYYAESCEVLEGVATVTQNGNVFTVNAETDCTVQVNFAPRDPAVVHFSVPEGVSCADLNAYVGDDVALPVPEGEPAVESRRFRFLGWVSAPLAEDSMEQPVFVKAGDTVRLTGTETTFYALYSYFVSPDELNDDQFIRVDAAQDDWSGEYLISCQSAYGLAASSDCFGSNVNNKLGTGKSVVDLADAGLVCEGNLLNGVTNALTYVIAPAENGTYTIKMKDENQYLAMAADTDSLTAYTSSNSDKTRWTISFGANGIVLTNAKYPNRSLQYNDAEQVFRCYNGAKKSLTLFAKPDGEYWFTTDPQEKAVCEEHSFGEWTVTTAPTCTEAGQEKHSCTVCGFTETRPVEALGHDWNEGEVTVEATHQAAGEMTYSCTRCDAKRTEEITKLANPFEDVVEGESYFFDPVMWALDNQVTAGVDDTHYGPDAQCSRAQIVTFLWRAGGSQEPTNTENSFSDVTEDQYYYKAVLWAVEKGITAGMGNGTFGAANSCTREQAMTFLWKAKGAVEPTNTENSFSDVTEGQYYCKAVLWAVEHGITAGMGDGSFGVGVPCSRAQIITFLYKAFCPTEE